MRGVLWLFQEIYEAVQGDVRGEKESLTDELSQLYMRLETGQITEGQFDEQEKTLLDRLDELEAEAKEAGPDEEGSDEDEPNADGEGEPDDGPRGGEGGEGKGP